MPMRLDASSHSKLLRRKAAGECRYCGVRVEWFDRFDRTRIPLTTEVPRSQVPERFRWYVDAGVAYPGNDPGGSRYCRIPHPAVCPALEHEGLPEEMADVVARLAVRMRIRIDKGEFVPALPPQEEEAAAVSEPAPEQKQTLPDQRHIVRYFSYLRLAPGRIEDLRCVAEEDGARCPDGVFSADQGRWEQMEMPHVPGRSGQMLLTQTGGAMWVWSLEGLDWGTVSRWLGQRCPAHADGSSAPDHSASEWEPFHPQRHADFVLAERPEGYDPPRAPEGITVHDGPRTTTVCAQDGCFNSTVATVHEGWLCWRCSKRAQRRARTHSRWQKTDRSCGESGRGR
ncbi:DUF6083 domain-containing protein [Streptomyces sp. NPDC054796]